MGDRQAFVRLGFKKASSTEVINTYLTTGPTLLLETDNSVNLCKQGIVLTHPHILSWMEFSAHLSHQNISGPDKLTAEAFDTASLGCAVPTVS
jgi:hypothetical protein